MISLKPEGHHFAKTQDSGWKPPHPGRWCALKFAWSALREWDARTPRGQWWQWENHCWTCYMRIRWHMMGMAPWRTIWEHQHRQFSDPEKIREMVRGGQADDLFLGRKYILQEAPIQ